MVDRLPIIQPEKGNYPEKSDEGVYPEAGFPDGGGPPRRDRKRSRSLGNDIVAVAPSAANFRPGTCIGDGQLATWDPRSDEDEEAMELSCYLKCYAFAEGAVNGVAIATDTDPFSGTTDALLPTGIKQSLIMLGEIQWGHDGVNKKVIINLSAGQVVKVPIAASYVRSRAKISVKYFPRLVVAVGPPAQFTYLNQDANIRNNIFNAMASPLLEPNANNYDMANNPPPQTPIHVDACIAMGSTPMSMGAQSDRSSRAVRRFFGTFPTEGGTFPAAGAQIFCPVAFGASSVMLQTPPADFKPTAAAATFGTLKMGMQDAAGNIIGELPANQFFPLIDGCQTVFVYNTTANGAELPFTLIYDMGL